MCHASYYPVHTGVIQASLVSSSKFYERFHQVWNESSERKKWQQWWREREKGSDCQKRLAWPLLRSILENMNHHTLKFKRKIVYNLTCLWMQITSSSGSVNRQHLNLTRMWMDLFQLYTDLIARNHFVPSFLLLHSLFNKLELSTIKGSYRNESILSKNQTFLV